MHYALPQNLDEALSLKARASWCVVAGGTDVYPALVEGRSAPMLDISALDSLRHIECSDTDWRIGALVTWTDVLRAELPASFDALRQAAREVGSVQIQNAATIAGNLCNASPAADGVPPLLALDAGVELRSAQGTRSLPLAEFILGNRRTALRDDELLTHITIPRTRDDAASAFIKLGSRRYLVISIAMVAVRLGVDDAGRVDFARVAVGACSEIARRLPAVEIALEGRVPDPELAECVEPAMFAALSPIDDIRGSGAYRSSAAVALVRRAVEACRSDAS